MNADGEPIAIREQEAKAGGSYFTSRIQAERTAHIIQSHAGG
jgi:hypothetical protein